jgi:hypothetical protein
MLSILFCSRARGNPDCGLPALLDSATRHIRPGERGDVEFLIKFDDDDDARMSDAELGRYPFSVRSFSWSRGEGRHGLHHAQEHLFAQRSPRSRMCLLTADDFVFTRSGFVTELLAQPEELVLLGPTRPPIESFARGYEEEASVRRWSVSFGDWSPAVSARLLEVCQSFGWQANVDGWLMGLSVVLYSHYGLVLWKQHEPFYERRGGYGLGDTPTYNNMELTGQKGPFNPYWFELLRRQARNVYLNHVHGTGHGTVCWRGRLAWLRHKLASQPWHRLPARVMSYAWRSARRLAGLPA